MTVNRDFKRLVRARMQKTGESYTAARRHFVQQKPVPGYAKLAGISDAAIKAKTGCTWARWVAALDYAGAQTWPHRRIAEYVRAKFKVQDWWCQAVTVGYERIKGLREIGQRRDGTFEAAKSKTFGVPLAALYRACKDPKIRARWLPDPVTVRSATAAKSVRLGWPDGSIVVLGFTKKGPAKSALAVQHTRLGDRATANKMKAFWGERLSTLSTVL